MLERPALARVRDEPEAAMFQRYGEFLADVAPARSHPTGDP